MAAQFRAGGGPHLGLSAALGEYVAFLDADDLWHSEKLTRQMSSFQSRPEVDFCITYVQNFWVPELEKEKMRFQNHRFAQPLPGFTTQALLARRALFDRVGPFNAALRAVDDTDWFMRAIEHGAVLELLPDVLVYRRMHHADLSRLPMAYSALLQVIKASLDRRRGDDGAVPKTYKL